MRRFLYLLAVALLLGGCSDASDAGKTSNTAVNSSVFAGSTTPQAANGEPALNGISTPPTANFVAVNKRVVPDGPGSGRPILRYEPAADNSQIASAMNSDGQMFEVRIWKKHPQLVKIESTWLDQKNKALYILLRTGKVMNITTDRIQNLKQATTRELLEIAGLPQEAKSPTRPAVKKEQ